MCSKVADVPPLPLSPLPLTLVTSAEILQALQCSWDRWKVVRQLTGNVFHHHSLTASTAWAKRRFMSKILLFHSCSHCTVVPKGCGAVPWDAAKPSQGPWGILSPFTTAFLSLAGGSHCMLAGIVSNALPMPRQRLQGRPVPLSLDACLYKKRGA